MIRLALCVAAAPALADSTMMIHHDPQDDDAWFARIEIYNYPGSSSFKRTLQSERGPVVVDYETLGGTTQADVDHDRVTVWSLPIGVIAIPAELEAAEDKTTNIFLFEYLGG